ncbi:U3 small nucleolar RNA-associated protein 14 homolog A [Spodoptera frugiperda]|uniref:U3 small nucleolar RNA-associated protein 14 homolog A n=1 Tax=Spodoptera frugiperda TaxID=7108 RepID=A0A9R0D8B9_SPOFR|nr:U3 small nucleolar RNA-associated protein 14 homolog A [Spodoptera frugiperda]
MEDIEDTDLVALEHDRLISAVSKLDKTQHITEPTRNEPTNLNSEFNLIKRTNKLNIDNVAKVLEDTAHHVQISKKLKKTQSGAKVLSKPLEKPQAERIKRATGYEETKKKVGRWDPVVARSRTVDYVTFPIKHVTAKLEPTSDFLTKFQLKSELEKELEEVDPQPMVEDEEEDEPIYPKSYEEMVEYRQHLAKMRAQQSYKAAKAKRQSKIKSKKFHRVLKKEKLKQELKEFEELQKKDPEEALKKLEAIEKARALERHTLRHKSTGKWAKNKLIRAKYDKEVRQQLADQLAVGRSLTKKLQDNQSSDDEADDEPTPTFTLSQDPFNPWMVQRSDKSNVNAEFDFGYKKFVQNKMNKQKESDDSDSDDNDVSEKDVLNEKLFKKEKSPSPEPMEEKITIPKANKEKLAGPKSKKGKKAAAKTKAKKPLATSNWDVEIVDDTDNNKPKDNLEYLKLKNQKTRAVIDEELMETSSKTAEGMANKEKDETISELVKAAQTPVQEPAADSNIDPNRFIEVKPKYLNTALSQVENEYDQLDDDQVVPRVNIEEVFEEDDVVASFRQEKEDEINKDKPEDINLTLPGWGAWGGKGVKPQKRKKNRFILKAPPKMPRRDENKGDIIIKEFKDPKLAVHKVKDVPFPFESVKDYEASIRAPLGNTFIPEKAHKKLIRPSVITKAGKIIEPMDEEELLVPKNRNFKNESVIKLLGRKK